MINKIHSQISEIIKNTLEPWVIDGNSNENEELAENLTIVVEEHLKKFAEFLNKVTPIQSKIIPIQDLIYIYKQNLNEQKDNNLVLGK